MLSIVRGWETFKDRLATTVHLTHWDLHVILGLSFFFLFAKMLRRPLTSLVPVIPVAMLELGNETLDFMRAWLPDWTWSWRETVIEIALTLAPPLLVVLVARAMRRQRPIAAVRSGWRLPPRRGHVRRSRHDDAPYG